MQRHNFWTNAEGYERTAKRLQYIYLQELIRRGKPEGRLVDVGCGTGNTLQIVDQGKIKAYTGVDISPEMLGIAQSKAAAFDATFIEGDFLSPEVNLDGKFDDAVCAACLHWFHPEQQVVIDKITQLLVPGGRLHLSTALAFQFLDGEEAVQRGVINEVRREFTPIAPMNSFASRRVEPEAIRGLLKNFRINEISLHEERLSFPNFGDFRDWHTGSGSVVASQFDEASAQEATDLYYDLLFKEYSSGKYSVCYAIALVNAELQ